MPKRALLDGEIVRPFDVEKPIHGQLKCVAKEHKMHLVEQHDRQDGAFIPRHFRHDPNVDRDNCPAGGGESDIHEHRKEVALSKALVEFDCSEWGLEKKIGDNIADAYVEFSDGHPRYGKGLAIEYQHENKGKDKKAATENYFEQNYSTIWLWRDQFNSSDDNVDLFGGKVCPIWPECVPKQERWKPVQLRDIESRWKEAYQMGLSKSGAPATLPPEWCDKASQKIWNETPWSKIMGRNDGIIPMKKGFEVMLSSQEHISEVQSEYGDAEIEIDIAPFLSREFWFEAYITGKDDKVGPNKPVKRPGTPFDDVQCRFCGRYNYWKNADATCDHCGSEYDWAWNINTGRISKDSIPESVDV